MLKSCKMTFVLPVAFVIALPLLTVGCGTTSTVPQACTVSATADVASASPDFTLQPVNTDFVIYPGQTEQLAFRIVPVGAATGTVSLAAPYPGQLQGITVTPATGAIGSTVSVTVTAAKNAVTSCFTGTYGVWTAGVPLAINVADKNGSILTTVPVNVVPSNPAFTPTTVNLPVMNITTAGGAAIASTEDYVDATLTITDPTNAANNYTGAMGIKGHGHSTWGEPKKPYRLNLDNKAPLLGMLSSTNWIMLANYDDKAMLRNDVSFHMAKLFGMFWTPSISYVEMYLNGAYAGTYALSEEVQVSKARLNIGSIDDTDNSGADLTGGYLGEIDHYLDETLTFTSPYGHIPIGLSDPDPPTATQAAYFVSVFNPAEQSMYSANFADPATGWQASWNAPSLVNYFLVEELASNSDADDFSSDYFYKPRSDSFFYRGPVWDMDLTFGNVNSNSSSNPGLPWVSVNSAWYAALFRDPNFLAMVKAGWAAVRPSVLTLSAYIDQRAAALSQAASNNYSRWPTLGEKVWPNLVAEGSYQGEVNYMKNWLAARIAYMDATYGH